MHGMSIYFMPQVRSRESLNFDIAEGVVDLPTVCYKREYAWTVVLQEADQWSFYFFQTC